MQRHFLSAWQLAALDNCFLTPRRAVGQGHRVDLFSPGPRVDVASGGRSLGDSLASARGVAGHNAQRHDRGSVVEPCGFAVRADLQLGAHGRARARLLTQNLNSNLS